MNFISRLKNKLSTENISKHIEVDYEAGNLYAPITGEYIPLKEIPDPAFSSGMLGHGCGVKPSEGKVYAPVCGKIVSVAETKHFVGIESADGASFLIHIGMDTVELNGKGFEIFVSEGQEVSCGNLLMTFDMELIRAKEYILTSAFVMAESASGMKLELAKNGFYQSGDKIGMVRS